MISVACACVCVEFRFKPDRLSCARACACVASENHSLTTIFKLIHFASEVRQKFEAVPSE